MNRRDCGFSNEELECLGCGGKLGAVRAALVKCPFESEQQFEQRVAEYLGNDRSRETTDV